MASSISSSEADRLAALERYDVLDTPREEAFERIVGLARRLFDVPIVLVTLVHRNRQWFKARCGLNASETSRDVSFCTYAIEQQDVMVVEDAREDARFVSNPLVVGEPGIRFYAGAPLVTPDGYRIGTLCIIDRVPRTFSDEQREVLADLSVLVMDELELRREVAERERTQEALARSEARFRTLVEQMRDWVWEVGPRGHFRYVSPGVEFLLGYAPSELHRRSLFDLMDEAEGRRLRTVLGGYLGTREPFDTMAVTLVHKNGSEVYCEVSGTAVLGDDGAVVGYRGVAHDVTAYRHTADALRMSLSRARELNQLKTRFVSFASHEFRTPLTAIQVTSEVIDKLAERGEMERVQRGTRTIQTSVRRLNDLIDNVLVLGRAESGSLSFQPTQIDVCQFVYDLVEEVRRGIGAGHEVSVNCRSNVQGIYTDPTLLQLALNNLLSNAVKYSDSGSTVRLDVERQYDTLYFRVTDEGLGIPEGDLPFLFEPFHRAENVRQIRGTGLGLAIVRQVVELAGGTLGVQSTLDEGSTFTLTLPSVPAEVAIAEERMAVD